MRKLMIAALVALTSLSALGAEHYQIDTRHAHAFVQFRISHMGFSWLYGRFNDFDGQFVFDPESPENSSASVVIEAASVDTNNAARDDHLRKIGRASCREKGRDRDVVDVAKKKKK